jgi:predicted nuclease with RNAse H fold
MKVFLGIDVQIRRGLSYFCDSESGRYVSSGWLAADRDPTRICEEIRGSGHKLAAIGIDAPRFLRRTLREWYWKGKKWKKRTTEKGRGRHCEVVLAAHKAANPQWTPLVEDAPDWMKVGIQLFDKLDGQADLFEVFPAASYKLLRKDAGMHLSLDVSTLAPGPRDMLDASVAALTVREFTAGRGSAVGGGDSLGEIVIPRPLDDPINEVLTWPST